MGKVIGDDAKGEAQAAIGDASDLDRAPAVNRLAYQPALDGVRGIAVAIVVIFHLDVGLFSGGYLGVSVFFTLSGFLITSLLVDEWNDRSLGESPGIDLGRFYVRRIKRLLPASMATLLAVALLAAAGVLSRTASLPGDLTAAAWNVFNWRELTSGSSYAELFENESAVAHFWSLAIEEQFYLVWPLVMLLLLRRFGLMRRGLLTVIGIAFAASAWSAIPASNDVTYFATWTRAAEILAGAALGVWTATSTRHEWPRWWIWLPGPALGVIVIASALTPTSSGWAYAGGLALFSLVSVALIAGLQVDGRVTRAVSAVPLVALGRVSYGVYLVHWPVIVVLDEQRLGIDGWTLAGVRVAVTAAIATAMFVVIERPIRTTRRVIRPLVAGVAAVAAMAAIAALASALRVDSLITAPAPAVIVAPGNPASEPTGEIGVDPNQTPAVALDADVLAATTTTTTTAAPVPPTVIAVFGDSIPAWLLRDAAPTFDRTDVVILNGAREACDGMIGLPVARDRRGAELVPPADCNDWSISYPATLAGSTTTDLALLVLGQAPVLDHRLDGEWRGPCDSIDWYLDDVAARVDYLREQGVRPIVAIPARYGQRISFMVTDDHRDRIGCVRSAMLQFVADRDLDSIDLDRFLCPNDECDVVRSNDGIHVNPEFAHDVLDGVLDAVLEQFSPTG